VKQEWVIGSDKIRWSGETKICSREEKEKLCAEWKRSGLSQREFSRRNNINVASLNGWLIKSRKNKEAAINSKARPINFLPVGNIVIEKILLEIVTPSRVSIKTYLPEEKLNQFLDGLLKWK
jgi:transposase-like protein